MKTYGFTELSEIPALLLPLYEDKKIPSELSWLESWLQNLELKAGKVYHVLTGKQPGTILLLGLGKPEEISYSKLGKYVGQAVRSLKQEVCLCCDTVSGQNLEFEKAVYEMAFACAFSSYEFTKIGEDIKDPQSISFLSSREVRPICQDAFLTASCVNHARDLGNTPSNYMTPEALADAAQALASQLDLECEILTNQELEALGAGAILGVNRGSSHGARLITLRYRGAGQEPFTALVGKGLTFDSGGYNLKSSGGMYGMKFDMCGAANALCALELIARRKSKVNVMAVLGATENKIGPDAYTCNDVLVSLSGKTIEITNTDAEGRLVLCDAITYAQRQGASRIIDLATLTGACVTALGKNYTGAFTNAPDFLAGFQKASDAALEKIWQLPLDQEFKEQVEKSDVAHITNSVSGAGGGSSLAAAFLSEFLEKDTQWIHLDIAGSGSFSKDRPHMAKGATGVMVRTLGEFFR